MKTVAIIAAGDTTLTLCGALLMYQADKHGGPIYATTHGIEIDANNPARRVIGPGVPMTKADLAAFAARVSVKTAYAGFVPENLLYTAPNMIAWWTPAAVRTTWFKSNYPEIGTTHGPAAHPALVFVAVPGSWYVFALRDSARPDPTTPLYHSPHFNVGDGGRICTGNVDLPEALAASAIPAYEDAFFRSHFTHSNRQTPHAVKTKGGTKAVWVSQLAKPDPDAMRSALASTKEDLQSAIARITQSNSNQ